jgi:hypothetical protein
LTVNEEAFPQEDSDVDEVLDSDCGDKKPPKDEETK